MSLTDDLDASLTATGLDDRDRALAGLARAYARELDGAAAAESRARRLAEDVTREQGPDSALHERVAHVVAQLTRRQALDRIGARYHAALVELLATPKVRTGAKPVAPRTAEDSPLGKLRLAGT